MPADTIRSHGSKEEEDGGGEEEGGAEEERREKVGDEESGAEEEGRRQEEGRAEVSAEDGADRAEGAALDREGTALRRGCEAAADAGAEALRAEARAGAARHRLSHFGRGQPGSRGGSAPAHSHRLQARSVPRGEARTGRPPLRDDRRRRARRGGESGRAQQLERPGSVLESLTLGQILLDQRELAALGVVQDRRAPERLVLNAARDSRARGRAALDRGLELVDHEV